MDVVANPDPQVAVRLHEVRLLGCSRMERLYAEDMLEPQAACRLAGDLLGVGSRRWKHSRSVAAQADRLAPHLQPLDGRELVAAAWVHDIGYATAIRSSGFHPVDGARYLRGLGFESAARLTAYHSCSVVEASRRGLAGALAEFPRPPETLLAALTFCDMTSGPNGERMTFDQRYEEILQRYGSEHLVGRSISEARERLSAAVDQFAHLV